MSTITYDFIVGTTVYITDKNRILEGTILNLQYRKNAIVETTLYYVSTETDGVFAKTEANVYETLQDAANALVA